MIRKKLKILKIKDNEENKTREYNFISQIWVKHFVYLRLLVRESESCNQVVRLPRDGLVSKALWDHANPGLRKAARTEHF